MSGPFFIAIASDLEFLMFCTPLARLAQCVVVVAAIMSTLLTRSSLVCAHCVLHNLVEESHSLSGYSDCDHSCKCHCSEPSNQHIDDGRHSHHDYPCCAGRLGSTLLPSGSSNRADDVVAEGPMWLAIEYLDSSLLRLQHIDITTSIWSSSRLNVLRI